MKSSLSPTYLRLVDGQMRGSRSLCSLLVQDSQLLLSIDGISLDASLGLSEPESREGGDGWCNYTRSEQWRGSDDTEEGCSCSQHDESEVSSACWRGCRQFFGWIQTR